MDSAPKKRGHKYLPFSVPLKRFVWRETKLSYLPKKSAISEKYVTKLRNQIQDLANPKAIGGAGKRREMIERRRRRIFGSSSSSFPFPFLLGRRMQIFLSLFPPHWQFKQRGTLPTPTDRSLDEGFFWSSFSSPTF